MDIAGIVDVELLYALELRHPITDAPLGVTFQIRSAGSEAAKKVLRAHTDRNLERRMRNQLPKSSQIEREELEKAASYIASWDWGGNTYDGKVPVLSMTTATAMLEKEAWIFAAVVEAAHKIGNFSPPSPMI